MAALTPGERFLRLHEGWLKRVLERLPAAVAFAERHKQPHLINWLAAVRKGAEVFLADRDKVEIVVSADRARRAAAALEQANRNLLALARMDGYPGILPAPPIGT